MRAEEPFDLILFGNESADAGNYQVGIRVAHALGLPVVTGLKKIEVGDGRVRCERDAGGARDVYEAPLPAVLTVLEGLNLPRYPSVPGRLRAKSKPLAVVEPARPESKLEKLRLVLPEGQGKTAEILGEGAGGRAEGRRGACSSWASHERPRLRRAGRRAVAPGARVRARARRRARGRGRRRRTSPPRGRPRSLAAADGADAIVAAGSDRGNELLAHVAAQLDQPFAANVTAVDGDTVTRVRWGGSLLEEARLHGSPRILSVAPHTHAAGELGDVETLDRAGRRLAARARARRGVDRRRLARATRRSSSAAAAASAPPRASRSSRSSPGCSARAVGCSRVVTSAGWRPHTDQVGQTGTKISADLYVACGISGATQHIAGAKGAKKILAINSDPEAPILASADYAVIGDLHEIVPAISAELRKARGT